MSPCSPIIRASTLRGATSNASLNNNLKRAESKIVPEPITRSLGKPENFHVAYAKISTGFVATKKIPSNFDAITSPTIDLNIFKFLDTKSKRVSPGFCAAPAQMTTRSAS
ncbi:Uncharacterised protein [Staphylococcus aureus]|nr:Uncharacterised protein [Staphylococcus aureus]